jgi:hypothetical protein
MAVAHERISDARVPEIDELLVASDVLLWLGSRPISDALNSRVRLCSNNSRARALFSTSLAVAIGTAHKQCYGKVGNGMMRLAIV